MPSSPTEFRDKLAAIAALSIWLVMPAGIAAGAELRVPEAFPTIRSAIDAALPGDTVIVGPGLYQENIDFFGKDIAVVSSSGPDVTIIEGGGTSTVTFRRGESGSARLDGFTITRSGTGVRGGGIYCEGASPVISNNRIRGNAVLRDGGGIFIGPGSAPDIVANRIESNVAGKDRVNPGRGGGIYCAGASPRIRQNVFTFNWLRYGSSDSGGAAIACADGATPSIEGNVFTKNVGGESTYAVILAEDIPRLHLKSNTFIRNGGYLDSLRLARIPDLVLSDLVVQQQRPIRISECPGALVTRCTFERTALTVDQCADFAVEASHFTESGITILDCARPRIDACTMVTNPVTLERCESASIRNSVFTRIGAPSAFVNCSPAVVLTNDTFIDARLNLRSDVRATNCIFWTIAPGQIFVGGAARLTATHCLVRGGFPGAGNVDADPLVVGFREDDLRLRPESPCVDAGTSAPPGLPPTDIEGQPRALPGRAGRPAVVDIGADEMSLEHAARFGTVGAGRPGEALIRPVLRVNGSVGDASRVVAVRAGTPLLIDADAPPSGPPTAPFVLYAWRGEPTLSTVRRQRGGLGFTVFPTPLDGTAGPAPIAIWNNLGFPRRLGASTRPSSPAPSVVVDRMAGLPPGITVTLQGFILDAQSAATVQASVTNAVVVRSE